MDTVFRTEDTFDTRLPKDLDTALVVRLDGHGFTRLKKSCGLEQPFDSRFTNAMLEASRYLVKKYNPDYLYTGSDEISLGFILKHKNDEYPYGGRINKINSIMASEVAVIFQNSMRLSGAITDTVVSFDSRCLLVRGTENSHPGTFARNGLMANIDERANLVKVNAISMIHHYMFGHKKGVNKNAHEKVEEIGPLTFRGYLGLNTEGVFFYPEIKEVSFNMLSDEERNNLPEHHDARKNPDLVFTRRIYQEKTYAYELVLQAFVDSWIERNK